ncbi:MAG: aldo/keto reductase family protein [Planctomycetes bacterium]|nr:aldo/keto reductase family protein [Planctomycetota bacterium]
MEYRRLGRSGLRVSEVVLGSWLTYGSSVDEPGTAACVRAALDVGIQTFDTADVYALGRAEEVLGHAIAGLPRTDLVLATKVFWPTGKGPNDRGLSRKHVVESCHASLRRLGTDYVDVYQCHRFDPEVPLEETVRAMEDLVRQGKALYWGVSMWTGAQIADGLRLARAAGGYGCVCNQPELSLLERSIEAEVLPVSRREGVGQWVFSPLAQGVLTGKYSGGVRPPGTRAADTQRNRFLEPYLDRKTLERVDRFAALAAELGMPPARLALAWCLAQPGVDAVVVGATRPEQVRENAAASGTRLDGATLRRLDALFPPAH